jgi:hypothetical protein
LDVRNVLGHAKVPYAYCFMENGRFREKTVKAESAFNIVPQNRYLDPDYSLRILPISAVTPTGLLAVLRLAPTVPGLPSFVVRWDDKQNTIDVDLEGNASDREAFKLECNGYKGHHPSTVSVEPRVFKIDIQLPGRKVYEACLPAMSAAVSRLQRHSTLRPSFQHSCCPKTGN